MNLIYTLLLAAILIFAAVKLATLRSQQKDKRDARRAFILNYSFPLHLREKLHAAFPALDSGQIDTILAGLRQWFLLIQTHPGQRFGMPSHAVDTAWHEFILLTRDYHAFCERAFGEYLHHSPFRGGKASEQEREALARTYAYAPLVAAVGGGVLAQQLLESGQDLFALDRVLGIEGGRLYEADELEDLKNRHTASTGCSGGVGCGAGESGGDGGGGGCSGGGCGS